jgi:hypothetical protein
MAAFVLIVRANSLVAGTVLVKKGITVTKQPIY